MAESEAVLACRLISRKTEPLEKMITRVQTARQEMGHLPEFDYGACRAAHSWACQPTGREQCRQCLRARACSVCFHTTQLLCKGTKTPSLGCRYGPEHGSCVLP